MKNTLLKYKIIVIIIIFSAISISAHSQNFSFFEVENLSNLSNESLFRPQLNIYASTFKPESKIGFYYFTLLNENWGQAYGGIIYKPINWLLISIGAGMEVDKNPYRFNIRFHVIKNKINFLQIYEYGGSGFWYHIHVNYRVLERNYLGIIAKRYYGLGLNYEHELKSIPLSFILSPLYDFEDEKYKLLMAIRYYL